MDGKNKSVLQTFAEAYNSYLEALHEVWREAQASSEEAYLDYAGTVHEVQTGAQQRAEEAYQKYVSAMKEAQSAEDAPQRMESIYREYLQSLQDAFSADDSAKLFEARRELTHALQKAWDPQHAQSLLEQAFSNYLRALHGAWAEIDVDAIDPYSLATIGQSLFAAAEHAANTLAQGGVRQVARDPELASASMRERPAASSASEG